VNCPHCYAPEGKPHTKVCPRYNGQPKLVEYGIQNEQSDLRAHVGVLSGKVYVYRTSDGVAAIRVHRGPLLSATQSGVSFKTAKGYAIPWKNISRILAIPCQNLIDSQNFSENDSTSQKGEKASNVVEHLIRCGYFPLPIEPINIGSPAIQRQGIDLIVEGKWRIQVKCDFKAGDGPNCTGNLYLQTAELNPFRYK